jgi:hypothetical protein
MTGRSADDGHRASPSAPRRSAGRQSLGALPRIVFGASPDRPGATCRATGLFEHQPCDHARQEQQPPEKGKPGRCPRLLELRCVLGRWWAGSLWKHDLCLGREPAEGQVESRRLGRGDSTRELATGLCSHTAGIRRAREARRPAARVTEPRQSGIVGLQGAAPPRPPPRFESGRWLRLTLLGPES